MISAVIGEVGGSGRRASKTKKKRSFIRSNASLGIISKMDDVTKAQKSYTWELIVLQMLVATIFCKQPLNLPTQRVLQEQLMNLKRRKLEMKLEDKKLELH
jgi:hypothetical protein